MLNVEVLVPKVPKHVSIEIVVYQLYFSQETNRSQRRVAHLRPAPSFGTTGHGPPLGGGGQGVLGPHQGGTVDEGRMEGGSSVQRLTDVNSR